SASTSKVWTTTARRRARTCARGLGRLMKGPGQGFSAAGVAAVARPPLRGSRDGDRRIRSVGGLEHDLEACEQDRSHMEVSDGGDAGAYCLNLDQLTLE